MRSLDWLRNQINKINQSRGNTHVSVVCDDAGFTVAVENGQPSGQTLYFAWDSITEAFAYKKDCLSVDQICLAIGSDTGQWIEITEEDEGYEHLIKQIPERIVGFPSPEEWWQRVALPPFETQWTQLYCRKKT